MSVQTNNSSMAVIEWNANFVVKRWAGEAEKIFGWSVEEAVGKHIEDLHIVDEESTLFAFQKIRLNTDGTSQYICSTNRNHTKDAKIIMCEWFNTVSTNNDGKIVSVLSLALDVTDRILIDTYRDMIREVLQILNEPGKLKDLIPRVLGAIKNRTGFDAIGIRLQDVDDFPYFVQEGFPKDFLLTENTLVERSVDGGVCRDKDGNICLECTCGLIISGKTDPTNPLFTAGGSCWTNNSFPFIDVPAEIDPRLHPRNECIHQGYASVALVPIRDGGRIVGLVQFNDHRQDRFTLETIELLEGIGTYIGAVLMRKRIEEEKLVLQQQLQQAQKLESLGVLAGGIAHDFNNILTIILGYCELIKMGYDTTEQNIPLIESAVERAAALCQQMLAYAGKAIVHATLVTMWVLVDDVVTVLRRTIKQNVVLKSDYQVEISSISGDANQLRQMITSLIINAAESIGEARGEVKVSLSKKVLEENSVEQDYFGNIIDPNSYVCMEVIDNGCGMSEVTYQRVFEPFYTTKFTGRGLGLSAVLGIITAHRGSIQIVSQLSKGTTIKVYLPV